MRAAWRQERGQTLVEVVVALALLGLAVGSAGALATASVHANSEAGRRSQAVSLASRELEGLRTYRDANAQANPWLLAGTTTCFYWAMQYSSGAWSKVTLTASGSGSMLAYTNADGTNMQSYNQYSRRVKICNYNGSAKTSKYVEVQVQWTEADRLDNQYVETVLTNWSQ